MRTRASHLGPPPPPSHTDTHTHTSPFSLNASPLFFLVCACVCICFSLFVFLCVSACVRVLKRVIFLFVFVEGPHSPTTFPLSQNARVRFGVCPADTRASHHTSSPHHARTDFFTHIHARTHPQPLLPSRAPLPRAPARPFAFSFFRKGLRHQLLLPVTAMMLLLHVKHPPPLPSLPLSNLLVASRVCRRGEARLHPAC